MDFDDKPVDTEGNGNGDQDNGGEEEFLFGSEPDEGEEKTQQNDAVIFVVDCSKSMRAPKSLGGKSSLLEVLAAACSFMKTKIITSDKDRVGIVFYACKLAQNPLDLPNIHAFRKLEFPDAQSIKDLDKLSSDSVGLETKYCAWNGPEQEALLCDVLSVCHNMFQGIEKLNYSRRIFLFTDNDSPNAENKHDQQRAVQRAHDLYEQNIDIELFPMGRQNGPAFNVTAFFADLISVDPDQLSALTSKEATATRFQELTKRIRQKEYKKRTLGKTVFHISPKMDMAVKLYNLVQEVKKPGAKNLDSKTNKPLKTVTRWICEETGSVLYPEQVGTYYPYGGEKVMLSKEDMKTIKKFDSPGIKLMGFKPRSSLKDYMNVRSSYFVTADDTSISGSSQVMDALIKQMIAKDKVAIVRVIPREASIVRFCAMLPQDESVDPEDNFQQPAGFHLVFLPYSDDIRSPETVIPPKPAGEESKVNDEQLKAAKLLIKNLTIDFDSRQFENPAIQKFYSTIQALALNEQQPEKVVDIMQPDYTGMSRFAEIIEQFKDRTFGPDYDFAAHGIGKGRGKRPPKEATRETKAKRKKNEDDDGEDEDEEKKAKPKRKRAAKKKGEDEEDADADEPMNDYDLKEDDEELKEKFANGSISNYSLAELKDLLKARKLKIGKAGKEEMLEELKKYLHI